MNVVEKREIRHCKFNCLEDFDFRILFLRCGNVEALYLVGTECHWTPPLLPK
jgi:hypothetical protein